MNEQFAEYASNLIDNLTTNEVKEGLEAAGIEVVSKYSGKPLSEVPYEDIFVGMELISSIGSAGTVTDKCDKKPYHEDNWLTAEWSNANISADYHFKFCNVKVK